MAPRHLGGDNYEDHDYVMTMTRLDRAGYFRIVTPAVSAGANRVEWTGAAVETGV